MRALKARFGVFAECSIRFENSCSGNVNVRRSKLQSVDIIYENPGSAIKRRIPLQREICRKLRCNCRRHIESKTSVSNEIALTSYSLAVSSAPCPAPVASFGPPTGTDAGTKRDGSELSVVQSDRKTVLRFGFSFWG